MECDAETGVFLDRPELEEIDDNVLAVLPTGAKIVGTEASGASHWTQTARIDVELIDKSKQSFFLKVAEGGVGRGMMEGEFESMKAIAEFSPRFLPHPVGWGTFSSDPNLHFMLSEYREMDQELPDMEPTCFVLAGMHVKSYEAGVKKFGFPTTTYNGRLAQNIEWCDTWEELYVQQMKGMLKLEEESQGPPTEEMQGLIQQIFAKVIPRLLRPMETNGHKITPSLVHGDFWHGNVSTDVNTGEPVTYDASAIWGHNEYDIRTMTKRAKSKFGQSWQREYLKHYPAAYPQEDFEGRSEIYNLRSKVHDAALFSNDAKFRETLIKHAKFLVDTYGGGYEDSPSGLPQFMRVETMLDES